MAKITIMPNDDKPYGSWLFVEIESESILDNLRKRFSRPVEIFKEIAYKAIKKKFPRASLLWSQYGYCDCGCSPGFKVVGTGKDVLIWVEITKKDLQKYLKKGG